MYLKSQFKNLCMPVLVIAVGLVCGGSQAEAHGLICRTPGFWGLHSGTEKTNSQNITQAVIDKAGGALGGPAGICGSLVLNTSLNSLYSALENMCVSVQGDQFVQLRRQLTAMALNCQMSGGGNDCSQLPSVPGAPAGLDTLFATCNAACAANNDKDQITSCINRIDCFNNGGVWDSGLGACLAVTNSCANVPLCDAQQGLCFDPPGPAGSSQACNAAIANGSNP